jgi:uncharacterized protein YneR
MGLTVTIEAASWYKEEMDLEKGDYIRYFVKLYGGIPTPHSDYYLGMEVGQEGDMAIRTEVEGITFYFNSEDAWFIESGLIIDVKDGDISFDFS